MYLTILFIQNEILILKKGHEKWQALILKSSHSHWAHEIPRPFTICKWHASVNRPRINMLPKILVFVSLGKEERRLGGI